MTGQSSSNQPSSARQQQFDEILADLMRAVDAGESVDRAQWLARHPRFAAELREFFAKHERVEKLVRPLRQAAANVLHVRCPHCHNPIELLDKAPLSDISCPSCGSSFSLIADNTRSHDASTKSLGQFELLDRVGIGQFGSVWKARDTKLDRTVAIKIPRNDRMDSAQTEMFLRDARAAAQLKHPNIVSVHEVGKQDDTVYIVSDLIQGATLKEWTEAKKLTSRETAELCAKIAKALNHAHEAGVIHRDLKPGNIMMDMEGEPHVVDFGLAKREAGEITMTVEGQILGTPAYMSPEQARGEGHTVDRRADIYSMGVILFELLTGELPFRGDKQMLIVQILNEDPPSLRKLNSMVPRDLETISLKCLQKERHKPYGTAKLLADDLQSYLNDRPILRRPVGPIERNWRWCRRNPTVAGLLATVALCLLVGTTVSSYFAIKAGDRAFVAEERRQEVESKSKLLRRSLYFSDMIRVQSACEASQFVLAGDLLDQHRPGRGEEDLCSFEWWYWNSKCHDQRTLKGHEGVVMSVAFSPDGASITSVCMGHTLKSWDVATGQETRTVNLGASDFLAVVFSADGTRIATLNRNEVVELWDTNTGRKTLIIKDRFKSSNHYECVAFNPQGTRIAMECADQTVKLYDTKSGQEMLTLNGARSPVTFSPDSLHVATGSGDGTMRRWDTATGHEIPTLDGHIKAVELLAFNPSGKQIASLCQEDYSVKLWDVDTGRDLASFTGHEDFVWAVAFSPDGARIASASEDKTIKIWNSATGQLICTLNGHTDLVSCAGFSPDGTRIVSGSDDGTAKHWDAVTGDETLTLKANTGYNEKSVLPMQHFFGDPGKHVLSLAFSPDGTRVVSGTYDGVVKLWDTATGQTTRMIERAGQIVAFSPDGTRIASASWGGTVKLWDTDTGQERLTLNHNSGSGAKIVAFSLDGTRIALASGQMIQLWDATTGQEAVTLDGHTWQIRSIAFSPDGTRIVSGSGGFQGPGELKVWDVATGRAVLTLAGHTGAVVSVAYSPDGKRIASASADRTAKLWNANTGDELLTFKGHEHLVSGVVFTPDGKRIVSGSGHNFHLLMGDFFGADHPGELKVWDVATGQETLTLKGHSGNIICIAISADGTRIASASFDGTIKIWNAPRFELPSRSSGHN